MFLRATRIAFAAFLASSSAQAVAQATGWTLSEVSGPVFVHRDGARLAAQRGVVVGTGDVVATGANGRAVLVKAQNFVTVAANSRISIPAATSESGLTRFFQSVGNAIFKVEKRARAHFSVDTPYLAAVVKGTTFSVTVGPADASLQVTEGMVEVATLDGGARDLVRPGSVAMISAADMYRLNILGDQPRVLDSPLRNTDGDGATGDVTSPAAPNSSALLPVSLTAQANPVLAFAIGSKPVDLGELTNGLITSEQSTDAVTVLAQSGPARGTPEPVQPPVAGAPEEPTAPVEEERPLPPEPKPDPEPAPAPAPDPEPAKPAPEPAPPPPDPKPEAPKPAPEPKPDAPKPDKDDGDKPGKGKPGKDDDDDDDKPGKGKPGKDDDDDDDKPGKGKPGKDDDDDDDDDDKPGKGKPGKDDDDDDDDDRDDRDDRDDDD